MDYMKMYRNEFNLLRKFENKYITKFFDNFQPNPLQGCIIIEYFKVSLIRKLNEFL